MKTVYKKLSTLLDAPNMFCPGCGHSIVMRLIAEVVEELDVKKDIIEVNPIGCGGMVAYNFDFDVCAALHGRAPAVATGVKRMRPDKIVLNYQGDGDLASIGMAETIHAANRGEHFTTVFVNNAIFGMTGGQMAPTTLVGQKCTTAIQGRDASLAGYPIDACKLLDALKAPAYIERVAVNSVANIRKAKAAIRKALELQMQDAGYTFVEILAPCPTNIGGTPQKAMDYVTNQMLEVFPLGVYREPQKEAE